MTTTTTGSTGEGQEIDIHQPYLTTNYIINISGQYPSRNLSTDSLLGSVAMFGGSFAPVGWAFCTGQTLKISDHESLFSILGTTYGGDGRTTFKLPDLRGRVPIGVGTGPGLEPIELGKVYGSETTTLSETPIHQHSTDGTNTGSSGGVATLSTTMPSLGLTPLVATQGIFPSRSLGLEAGLGDVAWFAGNYAPPGWSIANGQLLPIASNQALFSLLSTTFGGDGRSTFSLPDLRGRIAIGAGKGISGLTPRQLGERGGALERYISLNQTPIHQHSEPDGDVTDNMGNSYPISIEQPWLALNFQVATEGIYPRRSLEEQRQDKGSTTSEAKGSERFQNGEKTLSDRKANEKIAHLLDATLSIWGRAGANEYQLKRLEAASIQLSNLDTGLAEVRENNAIHLDRNAQGRGWFIDPTPLSNSEYNRTDPASGAKAAERGSASRHYDLLTTLLHEQAHLLGFNHVEQSDNLTYGGLSIGIRKTPRKHFFEAKNNNTKSHQNHYHSLNPNESIMGSIGMSGINFAPSKTDLAEGQLLSIENNSALYSIFQLTYGGDLRNFRLPDYAGRAALGNEDLGNYGGLEKRTLITSQLPAHSHSEPSLDTILGLDERSTDANSEFTLKSRAVIFEPFTNNGILTNTSTMSVKSIFTNTGILTNKSSFNIMTNGKVVNEGTMTNEKSAAIINDGILETSNGTLLNQGTLSGSGTLIGHYIGQGKLKPGNSTGGIKHHGTFIKDKGVIIIELAGHKDRKMHQQKTKHDFLHIQGDTQLGGRLKVKLIDDYILNPGKEHKIIDIEGERFGNFKNYQEGDLIKTKNHSGEKLFISYEGGDGNDVVLYTMPSLSKDYQDEIDAMSENLIIDSPLTF